MHLQIRATLLRSTGPRKPRQEIWHRRYAWMDTALPRAVQLLLRDGQDGDIIEFSSDAEGFQLGIVRLTSGSTIKVEWAPLVKTSPNLMKLMGSYL